MNSVSEKRKGRNLIPVDIDTSKPSAIFKPTKGRHHTLSVALPGSIIANAQSHDLKTLLAGQVARALAVFCVDEVIVFDDGQGHSAFQANRHLSSRHENHSPDYSGFTDPSFFLAHLLTYLETPPHLRKQLFPLHPNLRTAGALNSLDMPHHLRMNEWCQYREGVSLGLTSPTQRSTRDQSCNEDGDGATSLIEVGFERPVEVTGSVPEYARVTVRFPDLEALPGFQAGGQKVKAVSPSTPREDGGYYWGYQVRRATSLSTVITECPYDGGYDLTWGTSERGKGVNEILSSEVKPVPQSSHMLIVFGGVAGLEVAVKADQELSRMGITNPIELFDYWIDLCPGQGSRTIRTEEAIWIGLTALKDVARQRDLSSYTS